LEHYFTNNPNLKSELRKLVFKCQDKEFTFFSDNGVFSKDKIDYGSNLLINSILKYKDKYLHTLDVGCGYGLIGITLNMILKHDVLMVDVNKRAVHLTEMNIDKNNSSAKVIESNIYENVEDKYDLIVTNPPIRAGKNVVYNILDGAYEHLEDNGELWLVIRKEQGAKSTIEHLKLRYQVDVIEKSKGFYILRAKKS